MRRFFTVRSHAPYPYVPRLIGRFLTHAATTRRSLCQLWIQPPRPAGRRAVPRVRRAHHAFAQRLRLKRHQEQPRMSIRERAAIAELQREIHVGAARRRGDDDSLAAIGDHEVDGLLDLLGKQRDRRGRNGD